MDIDGETYLIGMGLDITERKKAEKDLSEANKLFEAVIEQSPIPMVIATPDGKLKIYNEACAEQLGFADQPGIKPGTSLYNMNQPWKDYDSEGNLIPVDELPLALALQGKSTSNMEIKVVRKDGSERWEIANGSPVFDDHGKLIAGFAAFPDITERRRTEDALLRSEELYRLLTDNSSDLIWTCGTPEEDFRITYINPAVQDMLGFSVEDFFKLPIQERMTTETLQYINKITPEIIRKKQSTTFDIQHFNKNNEPIDCELSVKPTFDSDNRHTGFQGRMIDITERKKAEEALRSSEEKFRTVIDQSPVSMEMFDLTGVQRQVNRAWEKMWEATAEDGVDKFNILTDPQIKKIPIYSQIMKAFAGQEQFIEEWFFDPAESGFRGRHRYMRSYIYPIRNEKNEIQNVILTHEDITDRKKAEAELEKARNYITNIIDSMPSILVGVDNNSNVTQWNKTAEQSTGISAVNAQGKKLSDVFPHMISEMEMITESIRTRETKSDLKKTTQDG